ncbi:glycoside hydrolase family 5 protein [Ramlibacter algicola]|uniref:Cellulase family glycosylhydrolase n=1 Tax=Ramlibacter algicola TaxID=2795217 RepID=A0A934UPV1_9BURK|nr:cellulase family glycosylhydrolase [Ramlibacter algicola]MBK0390983.1 cellulase family glycosylhydrolase [Ramlibacter algicola]
MDDQRLLRALLRRRHVLEAAGAAWAVSALGGCLWKEGEAQAAGPAVLGTNLSGLEWTQPILRRTAGTMPLVNYAPPRKAEIAWFASQGLRKNRLPISWEMLQPVLHDSRPNGDARKLVGEPGEFHAGYAQLITNVLDAHAAAGATCILDLHNYGRYRDFRYAADGSVPGLKPGPTPLHRAYSEDPNAIRERIFALAPGATLAPAHFADFWRRAAQRWKDHPGLAGWGLMNEPHDMPAPGGTEPTDGGGEDLAIWPAFARAAVQAIREVERNVPIYVGGNGWSAAASLADRNPGFPLQGENLVYEVHLYLDATSSGHAFDFDAESGKRAGGRFSRRAIDEDVGQRRLEPAVRWAQQHKVRLALTEVGLPVDDERWRPLFDRTMAYAVRNGVEVMTWLSGNHWPVRGHPLQVAPGWSAQGTVIPAAITAMQAAASRSAKTSKVDATPGQRPAAVQALLNRHQGSAWAMGHAFTDYVQGVPARDGQPVRAVADSGTGRLAMLHALATDEMPDVGWKPPVLRVADGKPAIECGGEKGFGLWCRTGAVQAGVRSRPAPAVPFGLQDEHVLMAVVRAGAPGSTGIVLQASTAEEGHASELVLEDGKPRARFVDATGRETALTAPHALEPGKPVVLTLVSGPAGQQLRVDGQSVATAQQHFEPAAFSQLLLGAGFTRYYPKAGFRGLLHGALVLRGRPTEAELADFERWLRSLAA